MKNENDRKVNAFSFKSRYILLDFFLIYISSIFFLIIPILAFEADPQNPQLANEPIFIYLFYCVLMISICITTIIRIRTLKLQPMFLIGELWTKKTPWLMILIVLYGIEGVNRANVADTGELPATWISGPCAGHL